MSHDRIDTDSDFPWPSGVRPGSLNRDSDIAQEALQRTKLHMTQAGITVSDDEVFEYLANAVAAAKSGPVGQDDGDGLLPCPLCNSASEASTSFDGSIYEGHVVVCTSGKCGCQSGTFPTKAMAKRTWNTRATPQPTHDAAEGVVNPCPVCGINNNSPFPCEHFTPPQPAPDAMREALAIGILNSLEETAKYLRRADPAAIDMDGVTQLLLTGIKQLRPLLPPSATGAAEPDYETAARALGFQQIPNGKWFHQGQNHNLERCFESAKEIFDRYFGSHWLATPPVRGDREMLCEAIRAYCRTVSKAAVQTSSDGNDRIYYAGLSVQGLADAILPVQPGAGERGSDAAEADRYFDLAGEFGNQLQTLAGVAQNAVDILAGRKYGNAARSPGHNARLILETALKNVSPSALPARQPPQSSREG